MVTDAVHTTEGEKKEQLFLNNSSFFFLNNIRFLLEVVTIRMSAYTSILVYGTKYRNKFVENISFYCIIF